MAKTILTVDDSASVRQMVKFTLADAGYAVIEAVDGEDALTKLASPVNLVITDLNMPNLDGIGLIRKVRANPACKGVPIIMLTTESQEARKQYTFRQKQLLRMNRGNGKLAREEHREYDVSPGEHGILGFTLEIDTPTA